VTIRPWIITWYREQDWPAWCSACDFKGSYKDWLARAEAGAKQQERLGYNVAKVIIEPDKFIEWSRINGGKVNHEARTAYAASLFHGRESTGN